MVTFSTKRGATRQPAQQAQEYAQLVIIGYGNTLRRDDGAGIVMAQKLADYFHAVNLPTKLITATQLLPEMAAELAAEFADHNVGATIFVDVSAQPSAADFEIVKIDVDSPSASSGHHLTPATLLLYAALLYGRNPHAWLVTIPGQEFGHGEGFSQRVTRSVSSAALVATALHQTLKEADLCTN